MSDNGPNPYPPEEKALNAALAKAQGEFPPIPKDKTATVQMKAGGTFTYAYADLSSILASVRPVLATHGLALVQRLEHVGNAPAIRTELRHAEGAVIAASFPIGERPQSPQQLGSLLTYLRRYAIVAMLGIAAEEDDDGASAGTAVKPADRAGPSPQEGPPVRPDTGVTETGHFKAPDLMRDDVVEDLSAQQRKKIFALKTKLTNAGLFDDEAFKAQLYMSFGVDSVTGLSKAQASDLIERLLLAEKRLDEEEHEGDGW